MKNLIIPILIVVTLMDKVASNLIRKERQIGSIVIEKNNYSLKNIFFNFYKFFLGLSSDRLLTRFFASSFPKLFNLGTWIF